MNHIITALGGILKQAVDDRYLKENPAEGIKRIPLGKQRMDYLTFEELDRVVEAAPDEITRELITVAADSGLRRGELLGLRWEDVDFEARQLEVKRQFTAGELTDELKTPASERVVDIPASTVQVLRERHMRLGRPSSESLVWDRGDGLPVDPDTLVKLRWRAALKAAGIQRSLRWHDLRHTYASHLLYATGDVKLTQVMLGHSSFNVTMDRYAHLMPQSRKDAMERLELLRTGESAE